ncbi:histone deacetylase HDT3-like [Phragmites australis]|uniref:histone deacetylase HDT3-like n=1 Tax=Phragmites australis TaxID=29695 RepID=UPI002D766A3E|nr:histone deacetylase HDT3-like [Phragmites australis]
MEFWGEEVKPGMTISCKAGDGYVIHLSQAALGESKKGSENVVVSVKVDDKKLVIGTLSAEKHPQIMCDLIFDTAFELSHSSKTTSVFLTGYKSVVPDMFESDSGEDEDEELETNKIPMKNNVTEKTAAKVPVKDGNNGKLDDDDETSSGDDDFSDDSDDDSEMSEDESSGEDEYSSDALEGESDDSVDDDTPKKPEVGKKRAARTALKTPASDKKAKIAAASDQKTGDKGVNVATPHPPKQASKTPADKSTSKTAADKSASKTPAGDKKSKEKSPKSGSHACKSCSKTFASEVGLKSHQKDKKHEA